MNFLIDFLCISFLWKVNRVGGLGKEIISKLGGNIYEQRDFLIDFLGISFLWKVNRVGGLGKEIISKLGVNFLGINEFPVQFPFPTQSCPQLPNLKLTFISARVIL